MRILKLVLLSGCCLLTACAGSRSATVSSPVDYVEIDNPAVTMSNNAPATIWVPRRYVESGVPRGGEIIKSEKDKVPGSFKQSPRQAPAVPAVDAPLPIEKIQTVANTAPTVRNQLALLEIGENGLRQPFYEKIRRVAMGPIFDPDQMAFLPQYPTITDQREKGALAQRMQKDHGVNVMIYVSAPGGVAPGKVLVAEVFDPMGGGLLRRFAAVIPLNTGTDQITGNSAIESALLVLTEKVRDLIALLPWYTRIKAVEGNRAYLPAGKEAGLRIGQALRVYHGGQFVEGLGFAPGESAGSLEVSGFVGPNGSYCLIKEGQIVQATDVVSVE